MEKTRTQVVIIGAGPAGLLLGQLLQNAGIDNVILERRTPEYVLSRIRAGVLEDPTIRVLHEAGAGERCDREGIPIQNHVFIWDDKRLRVPLSPTGKRVTVYGQTEVTKDLCDARTATGGITYYEAENVQPHHFLDGQPRVTYEKDGRQYEIECDFIAGCDGYHGVSRASVPKDMIREYEHAFPFGWLGILSDTPPVSKETLWMNHPDGFTMCSLRSFTRSRYYIQVPLDEDINDWDADRFWAEFKRRLPEDMAKELVTGPALEMSIAPLRSFVAEPIRFGKLFLVGDAAHIVPPTGAKGLNLALGDAKELFAGLKQHYAEGSDDLLDGYSEKALERIWKGVRFSWWMTNLTHKLSDDPIERKMQIAEFDYMAQSEHAQMTFAENFVGLD